MISTEQIKQEIAKQMRLYASGEFESYFKYCSDDPKVIDGIFTNQKIRFTQPRAFNDPLEFSPTMWFGDPQANYQSYDLNGIRLPSIEQFYRIQAIESQINNYGILSLTKIPISFDMWIQYANGHRGFLIEFVNNFWHRPCMKSKTGDEYPVRKVEYVDDYAINLEDLVNENNEIPLEVVHKELFYKKTSRWQHEHEYRMVRPLTDSPDYKPPKTTYSYTDVITYLFPFDWGCISSFVLGANMSTENKRQIAQICEEHNIPLLQAFIVRDHKDMLHKPSTVLILPLSASENKEVLLQAKPQLFCTDTVRLGNQGIVKIAKLTDLPYYAGHEEVVNQFYRNSKLDSDN